MPKRIADATTQVTVRLDDEILERVQAIAAHFEAMLGTGFGRSDALRMIVGRGIAVVEAELPRKAKRKK